MNLSDLLQLRYPNCLIEGKVVLQDDGNGPYIREWNLPEPEPAKETLDEWATELDLRYRQYLAVSKRVYPPVSEQLDMIYKDQMNNTSVWRDTITRIKQLNPKPEE